MGKFYSIICVRQAYIFEARTVSAYASSIELRRVSEVEDGPIIINLDVISKLVIMYWAFMAMVFAIMTYWQATSSQSPIEEERSSDEVEP
jgi:hypothetical protein